MARNYPANTHMQKFLEESYNKERDARLGWFRHKQQGSDKGSKQYEVFRRKLTEGRPQPGEELLQLKQNSQPKSYRKRIMKYDDNFTQTGEQSEVAKLQLMDMRPVQPWTRERLYDGFTKEGKGRYQYLQDRYQENPENKYRYPLLSSWEYGWRLSDVIKKEDIRKPAAGRTRIVADTFYTRTGIPSLRCQSTY